MELGVIKTTITQENVLPHGWSFEKLINCVDKFIDYRGRTPKKLGMDWGGGSILALSANNVQMGRIDLSKEAYYGGDDLYRKWMQSGECEKGDILITMEAPLGNIAQIPDDNRYILSQRVILIKPSNKVIKDYFYHFLQGSFFQRQLVENATGSTALGIQRKKLERLYFQFPSDCQEQKAIATALSDVDTLIAELDALIEKKKAIKKGMMQQLLTPSKSSAEWRKVRITEVCNLIHGFQFRKEHFVDDPRGIKVIKIGNVHYNELKIDDCDTISSSRLGEFRKYLINPGDILMSLTGNIGRVVRVPQTNELLLQNYRVGKFEPINLDKGFLSVLLSSKKVLNQLELLSNQAAQANFGKQDFDKVWVDIPTSLKEQQRIANIIEDLQIEISLSQTKRKKLLDIKLGMMQELLTGKTRLV